MFSVVLMVLPHQIICMSMPRDRQETFGHPVLLMETFVDPERFRGTVYKAAYETYVGKTKGFRRTKQGCSATAQSPEMLFLKPLRPDAGELLGTPCSTHCIVQEDPKSCSAPTGCNSSLHFSPASPIPAAVRVSVPFSPFPPGRASAGCAAARPSRIGPKVLTERPGSASENKFTVAIKPVSENVFRETKVLLLQSDDLDQATSMQRPASTAINQSMG